MKIHLVDGTYELFRGFYGPPPKKAPDGREVGATVGLLRSLLALLSAPDVTHVACAFDHVVESFRNDLYAGYKTGEGINPDLFAQFSLAEEAVRALGIVVWPMVEFEADDALATAAVRFQDDPAVQQIVICSRIRTWPNWSPAARSFVGIAAGRSSMIRPRWSRNTASPRPRSPTGWPWWATRRMASRAFRPGGPNRRPPCWPSSSTSKISLPIPRRGTCPLAAPAAWLPISRPRWRMRSFIAS